MLLITVNRDWPLHVLDIKNAFLNCDLEEVYIEIPSGLEIETNIGKVCRLKKSLYGLKQSPRTWFDRFTKAVKRFGYSQCQSNHTLFAKHTVEGRTVIIIVYVDDIILIGDHLEEISKLKSFLAHEFEIKDGGNLKYFFGMEIARSKMGTAVSQCKYVLNLLNEIGMLGCKPVDTHMTTLLNWEWSKEVFQWIKGDIKDLWGKSSITLTQNQTLFFRST